MIMNSSVLVMLMERSPPETWEGALAKSRGGARAVLHQPAPPSTLFVHQNMPWEYFRDLHPARISPC